MPVDLKTLLLERQKQLGVNLEAMRRVLEHPGAKGDAAEFDWVGAIDDFLPRRYRVSKAFVIDADGEISDQLDLVVHDRQYCPLFFDYGGSRFIPAESVYAVFEIKQELTRENVLYAAEKAASVRKLRRTSREIVHAGGIHEARQPFPIPAGVLVLVSSWNPPLAQPLLDALAAAPVEGRLDLGCALEHGTFEASYAEGGQPVLETSTSEGALMFLLLRLFERLQRMGTVSAIDLREYSRSLEE